MMTIKARRTRRYESFTKRVCFLCQEAIPEREGLNVQMSYLIHIDGPCREFFDRERWERPGRARTTAALLDLWLSGASGASGAVADFQFLETSL